MFTLALPFKLLQRNHKEELTDKEGDGGRRMRKDDGEEKMKEGRVGEEEEGVCEAKRE